MWFSYTFLFFLVALVDVVFCEKLYFEPSDKVRCSDGLTICSAKQTCCKNSRNDLGCCGFVNATCCEGGLHCCPSGYHCSDDGCTMDKQPIKSSETLEKEKLPQIVVCPDQKSSCNDGQTCCVMTGGAYGCCPLPDAVCCTDHLHCCPSGSTCDVTKAACRKQDGLLIGWLEKDSANQLPKDVICPDETQCRDGQTCCLLAGDKYGCCPFPDAVCCSDHLHCCPSGSTCDVAHSACRRKDGLMVDWQVKESTIEMSTDVICPDKRYRCETGSTCCKATGGSYNCCPLPHAVCCEDHLHCCPSGSTCDVAHSTCLRKDGLMVDWLEKKSATQVNQPIEQRDIVCPDGKSYCPDYTTCCLISDLTYGCCPAKQAVCCNDRQHCCPHGFKCNEKQGRCTNSSSESSSSPSFIPWFKKVPSYPLENKPSFEKSNGVICPNKTNVCDEGYPCCTLKSGKEGCCMYKNGVCCHDHGHCCPQGTVCSETAPKCVSNEDLIEVTPIKEAHDTKIVRCDREYYCLDGQTCCKSGSAYMCCPYLGASCCSNGRTCCKMWCLLNKCIPYSNLNSPFSQAEEKDHESSTLLASKAVWCDEGQTLFCDEGFQCDVSRGRCLKESGPTLLKFPQLEASRLPHVCLSTYDRCAAEQTCCENGRGVNACCPYKDAVCCEQGGTCCPSGSRCLASGSCESISGGLFTNQIKLSGKDLSSVPKELELSSGLNAKGLPEDMDVKSENQICPDKSECEGATSCCILEDGQYACCQFENAVCCPDRIHCCPNGYRCNEAEARCDQAATKVSWEMFTRRKASKVTPPKSVNGQNLCFVSPGQPATHRCPSDYSCCMDKRGSANPVCCNRESVCCDGFCCPQQYRCGFIKGQCVKELAMIELIK